MSDGNKLIYLANPGRIISEGVGFPREDVFAFDEAVFSELARQWAEAGKTQAETWALLAAI